MKKKIELKTYISEQGNKVFVLNQDIKGLNEYERAKAIENFIDRETKVLEMAIETHLRQVFRDNGISINSGSKQALERAFIELDLKGKRIDLLDRYSELDNANFMGEIIGESPSEITCILENDTLGCAVEVVVCMS